MNRLNASQVQLGRALKLNYLSSGFFYQLRNSLKSLLDQCLPSVKVLTLDPNCIYGTLLQQTSIKEIKVHLFWNLKSKLFGFSMTLALEVSGGQREKELKRLLYCSAPNPTTHYYCGMLRAFLCGCSHPDNATEGMQCIWHLSFCRQSSNSVFHALKEARTQHALNMQWLVGCWTLDHREARWVQLNRACTDCLCMSNEKRVYFLLMLCVLSLMCASMLNYIKEHNK